MIREPAVAGQFYPGTEEALRREVAGLVPDRGRKRRVFGIVSPHAGYMYSGAIAGEVFSAVEIPRVVVILGPNHHGVGARIALYPAGSWRTPLGEVPVDPGFSTLLRQHAPEMEEDERAHRYEHSLEVQVPFLQHLRPDVAIVPVCLGFGGYGTCASLGKGLAAAVAASPEPVLVVASSDMSHFEPAERSREKDGKALERVTALDPEGLVDVCRSNRITMCGVVPAAVMLVAAKERGAQRAEIVRYGTSGDVTGDDSRVVGYAAVTVE